MHAAGENQLGNPRRSPRRVDSHLQLCFSRQVSQWNAFTKHRQRQQPVGKVWRVGCVNEERRRDERERERADVGSNQADGVALSLPPLPGPLIVPDKNSIRCSGLIASGSSSAICCAPAARDPSPARSVAPPPATNGGCRSARR
eukprot:87912-Chlamydomonas_euryale.AAC.1